MKRAGQCEKERHKTRKKRQKEKEREIKQGRTRRIGRRHENETTQERRGQNKKDRHIPRKSKTNEKQQVKIRNNMKEQNKVRKIGTHREIAKQLDNKLRHKGKQTRQHGKERNALRNQATRERTARHDKK